MSPFAFVPTALLPTRASLRLSTPTLTPLTHPTPPSLWHRPLTSTSPHLLRTTPSPPPPSPAKSPSRILLWFHTDLRLHDNPALRAALRAAAVPAAALVPVAAGAALDPRARPLLAELKAGLVAAGSDLLALPGAAVADLLIQTCKKLNLTAVYFNRSVLPHRVALEHTVAARLRDAGIAVERFWGNVLQAPTDAALAKRKSKDEGAHSLTAMTKRLAAGVAAPERAPERIPRIPVAARQIKGQIPINGKVGGGSLKGLRMLERMERRTETLAIESTPDLAIHMKLFLDYGAVSGKMVAQKTVQVMGACKGRTFSELVWRDYACFAAHRGAGVVLKQPVAI